MTHRRYARRHLFAFLLLILGSVLFSGCSWEAAPQSIFDPAGAVAREQLDLLMLTLWFSVGIFIVVGGALVYAIFRFRSRPDDPDSEEPPEQVHGNTPLEIAWTIIPFVIVVIVAIPTVQMAFSLDRPPETSQAEEVLEVDVTAHQWWWEFEYPEYGLTTANDLHVPVGRPVHLNMRSADVVHSFWVPKLAGKVDVMPSEVNRLWFEAERPGVFYGQCAEFCGTAHADMRMRVVAEEPEAFEAWVEGFREEAEIDEEEAEPGERLEAGAEVFEQRCTACHTVDAFDSEQKVGPNLARFGIRETIAAGKLENTEENLARWIRDPQSVKPGVLMPNLGLAEEEIEAVVEYLHSLD